MSPLRWFVRRHAVALGIALVLELLVSVPGLHAESAVKWNWRLPFPTGNELHGVVHGQGTFVVVGDHGTLLTSTNGATWVARDALGEASLNAVAHGDGGFVAVGDGGTVLTSLDAVAWKRTTLPGAYRLDAIRIDAGSCLIAAHRDSPQASAFFTSTNLTDWTRRDLPKDQWIHLLTQGNGIFLAGGYSEASSSVVLLRSEDGLRWTRVPNPPPREMAGLCHGNGRFVACGRRGGIWTSEDGLHWDEQQEPGPEEMGTAGFVAGRFLIPLVNEPTLLASTDGRSWEPEPSDALRPVLAMAQGGGRVVAVGVNGQIIRSLARGVWSGQTAYATQRYQRVGSNFGDDSLTAVTFGRDRFVAVGYVAAAVSPNGKAWVFSPQVLPPLTDVIDDGSRVVAVGMEGVVATSDDGLDWSSRTGDQDIDFASVRFINNRYLAVGQKTSSPGGMVIVTSPNLATWRTVYTGPESRIDGITFGGGRYVVSCPDRGVLLTSTDGETWSEIQTGTTSVAPVSHDPIHGFEGINAHSVDGIRWEFFPGAFLEELDDFTAAGVVKVALDSRRLGKPFGGPGSIEARNYGRGRIFTSLGPPDWQLSAVVNPVLYGMAYGKDTFVAVGPGTILQSDPLSATPGIHLGIALRDRETLELTVETVPGARIQVERSRNLGGWEPLRSWATSRGYFTWEEPVEPGEPERLFRAVPLAPSESPLPSPR